MIHRDTEVQLRQLSIHNRPLIICDVDEVILQFIPAFERYLAARDRYLDKCSFALNGNIRRFDDRAPVAQKEVGELLFSFFETETHRLDLVPGALEALQTLAESAQIVLLSNIYGAFRQARIDNLKGHGLSYPVITNEGPKGPAVVHLASRTQAPVFFLDDTPTNIHSVLKALPGSHVIHFIADARFAELVEPIAGVRLKTSHWPEAHAYIGMAIAAHAPAAEFQS